MGGDFAYLDIVFLAMVAGFLIFRLRSVLGRRTGTEKRPPDPFQPPAEPRRLGQATTPAVPPAAERAGASPPPGEASPGALAQGLRQIAAADPSFTPESFVTGAGTAFSWIVEAFAKGDTKALRPLLHDEVYNNFAAAIEARTRAGETHETVLVGIKSADLLEARLQNRGAFVTVKFVSEQVNVTRNREAEVIEGDPVRVVTITDIWTFARDIRSRDPNWSLVATRSSN
ncbi:MAG: Tim44/TimA family putative adaptor protein [Alphaproteobacteria bacterium]